MSVGMDDDQKHIGPPVAMFAQRLVAYDSEAPERRALAKRLRELGRRWFDRIRIQDEPPMPRLKARLMLSTGVQALRRG